MGMLFTSQRCKKPKKKPGWQEAARQEAEWLAGINKLKLAPGTTPFTKAPKKGPLKVKKVEAEPVEHLPATYLPHGGTKKVLRPHLTYRDDPEMLKRELAARERKFSSAPAYNKGGAVLITDEMMKDITAGLTRRR
jgi:hypothetical protein